jgi:hypothetical protein
MKSLARDGDNEPETSAAAATVFGTGGAVGAGGKAVVEAMTGQ